MQSAPGDIHGDSQLLLLKKKVDMMQRQLQSMNNHAVAINNMGGYHPIANGTTSSMPGHRTGNLSPSPFISSRNSPTMRVDYPYGLAVPNQGHFGATASLPSFSTDLRGSVLATSLQSPQPILPSQPYGLSGQPFPGVYGTPVLYAYEGAQYANVAMPGTQPP
jgi:hypothetical protein